MEEEVDQGKAKSKEMSMEKDIEERQEMETPRKTKEKPNESLEKNEERAKEISKEPIVIRLPFPSRQSKPKFDEQLEKFMEIVKNLEVSIPFTELIRHVPAYAKYMKDIITKKRNVKRSETIAFTGTSSAILQGNTPPKLKDPGSFSIPCTIGDTTINKALCDLGASVSVMPYSVCKRLGAGTLRCTNMTLQMADRTTKKPLGIWEDVPVRVGKFFIPVDL